MIDRGFGVDAGLPQDVAIELAGRCEALGYLSLWTTDVPGADGLADVAAFARGSKSLRVGIGVLALDRNSVENIARRVVSLNLPEDRLLLGIGSGASKRPLDVVSAASQELRELLPHTKIVVGAMGPKMCALAGRADGVLLNWLTPSLIPTWRARIGNSKARLHMYVRAALEPDGRTFIARQVELYKRFGMKNHFDAVGVPANEMGVVGRTPDDFNGQLRRYEAVLDETIVRAIPASTRPDDLFAIVTAAAPASAES
jgi:alkanesulfonate monooxygenase SsuD/methylene tetrahydromethanopterin reductase-like flavin-dependent oxidoreductase (luciferase family)